jgi:hypothetical protein
MKSIRDALAMRPATIEVAGCTVQLRRPSALDLVEALEVSANNPSRLHAWFVWRHLIENGDPVFGSLDEALAADAHTVTAIAREVERLYAEGRD